jgi:transposase InsO family protein
MHARVNCYDNAAMESFFGQAMVMWDHGLCMTWFDFERIAELAKACAQQVIRVICGCVFA